MNDIIIETRHYYKVPYETTNTIKYKSLRPTTCKLYIALCRIANDYADKDGWFYKSIQDLSAESGLERKSVLNAKKQLEDKHFIDIKKGRYVSTKRRACNYYRINGFSFRKV